MGHRPSFAVWGIVVFASSGIAACGLLNPSRLVISNVGTNSVVDLSVTSTEGQTWSLGDLPPGETAYFRERLDGEGALQVEFFVGGSRLRSSGGCYYTSGGLNPADATVTIREEDVLVECRSG